MKVILATDPIHRPLTGIGRYTLELAIRFSTSSRISKLGLFNFGRWQRIEELARYLEDENNDLIPKKETSGKVRRQLSNNRAALTVYKKVSPYIYALRLNKFSKDRQIYHSPNFILPPYKGPKVATFHDLSILKFPECHPKLRVRYLRYEMARSAKTADIIITDTETVRQEVIDEYALSDDRVVAIPLASTFRNVMNVEPNPHALFRQLGLQARKYFVFVSTLEPRKNLNRVLNAYESLSEQIRSEFPLVLIGNAGWEVRALTNRVQRLVNEKSLIRLGFVKQDALEKIVASAAALIYVSLYEGFGLPIVEAQSLGTPVITSKISCMPEVAGMGAILVDPYSSEEIAEAMYNIVTNDELTHNLINYGTANNSKYTWEITTKHTLDVYEKIF